MANNISRNIELVFKGRDCNKLSGPAYQFITLSMGHIAHFSRHGFAGDYSDLRDLARSLQTSEYSDDPDHNLEWANELDRRGEPERAETIREVVAIAHKYEEQMAHHFGLKERERDLGTALRLAEKHGYTLLSKQA